MPCVPDRITILGPGTLESYSLNDTTPNIKWRSDDTNWYGALNQSVHGGTITSFLSCGGDWSADGTTYSATKALAAYPTSAIAVHNQYNNNWGTEFVFLTKAGGSSTTDGTVSERFRIDSDGKLYKGGNQFYPLVNYSEYATFTAVSVGSNSYTDLRTILSSYTPKKAGNIIVIHHQSQCWQGTNANGSGDAMWKIQKQEGGGSWTDVIANERIMGNMDGRNYTGNSGLARHHRTVHLMGSFECAGTSINLKTQGKVDFTSPGLQWYHNNENILQVWEYEKG